MRISGLHIESFGQLKELTLGNLDADIVCVSGPNEVGKTTVFDFIRSMLYGIYPVTLESHPYAPRDGGTISGALSYHLADGTPGRIQRRLRSAPDAEWTKGDGLFAHPQQIKNRTLPVVDHVSQAVFRDVYALSLLDLKRFEAATFREIEERLLGGLNAAHVRPARAVAEELHVEASKFWRRDNRGKPRARALTARKRELADELRGARRTADTLRDVSEKIDAIESELTSLYSSRERLRQVIADASAARTAADRGRSIKVLRMAAEPIWSFGDIPDDPVALLENYRAELRELDNRLETVRSNIKNVDRSARRPWPVGLAYANRADIRSACRRFASVQAEIGESAALRSQQRTWVAAFETSAAQVMRVPDDPQIDLLVVISQIDRDTLGNISRRAHELAGEDGTLETDRVELAAQNRAVGLAGLLLTFAAMMVWAFGPGWLAVLSTSAALGTIAMAVRGWREMRRLRALRDNVRGELIRLRPRLLSLLGEVEAAPRFASADISQAADELDRLVSEAQKLHTLRGREQELQGRRDRAISELRRIAEENGLNDGDADAEDVDDLEDVEGIAVLAETLLARVSEAEVLVRTEPERTVKRAELEEQIDRLEARRASTDTAMKTLVGRLKKLGEDDFSAGVAALAAGRAAAVELVRLGDDGSDIQAEGNVEGRLPLGEAGSSSEVDEQKLVVEEAEVVARIEELDALRAELQTNQIALAGERTVDDVEGELEGVEADLNAARMRHDMLRFLEALVRRADERFREKHQPDVIARANGMLDLITDGRYRRIFLDEKTLRVHVVQSGERTPRPIDESVSQGTRDQVYLALRLALAEHMDESHEAIPVFLDEVFVTWDRERRQRFYPVLLELSKRRQVLLLTCHGWFEEEALVELGAHVVPLDRIPRPEDTLQMRML